ncbi:phenylacetate-CoA ligase [Methanolobus vulcani]|uniref:Phenylacetate-CoA ligase n=1 Tax=Methanolobus vulcani TaxID=38026 RepID=A0A7Z7AU55_9EURY|nr:phenylacetate--CoA ligase family protein [Methanolobus vulcani]SDF23831.1 phenylacetate-CoA ligase [Methanolobus vulcani]
MSSFNKLRLLHQARKNQWLKPSELEGLQIKKLRHMVKHAYNNTIFYREKFKSAGIHPNDIKTLNDLNKIPFTTKEELRQQKLESRLVQGLDLRKCFVTETSGSTGIPLKVVYDEAADDFSKAINLRSHIENGLRLRSKWAVFGDPHHYQKPRWFQKLRIFNATQISAFDPVSKQIEMLGTLNPEVLGGYTSSIKLIAEEIDNKEMENVNPKMIFGTSELLDSQTRKYINSVFDLEMVDHFGCVELNRTAWECREHMGYHIDADSVIMEFVENGESVSPGERGEIVYTGLYNYAMPLIRYRIGDIGIPSDESCSCGRGLPLMKLVEGRSDSFMQTSDGRIFSPIIWTLIIRQISGISQLKAIQERKDKIKIQVVKNDMFSQYTPNQIVSKVRTIMGNEVIVEVETVDEIPKDKSGKVRSAISNVKIEW